MLEKIYKASKTPYGVVMTQKELIEIAAMSDYEWFLDRRWHDGEFICSSTGYSTLKNRRTGFSFRLSEEELDYWHERRSVWYAATRNFNQLCADEDWLANAVPGYEPEYPVLEDELEKASLIYAGVMARIRAKKEVAAYV